MAHLRPVSYTHLTSNYGTPELRKAITEKLKRDNGVEYTPEEILVTIGVGEGTYAAVAAFLNPGDEVLVPDPVWLNYIHVPNFFEAVPVSYPLREENDFQIDLKQLEALITDKTLSLIHIYLLAGDGGDLVLLDHFNAPLHRQILICDHGAWLLPGDQGQVLLILSLIHISHRCRKGRKSAPDLCRVCMPGCFQTFRWNPLRPGY